MHADAGGAEGLGGSGRRDGVVIPLVDFVADNRLLEVRVEGDAVALIDDQDAYIEEARVCAKLLGDALRRRAGELELHHAQIGRAHV